MNETIINNWNNIVKKDDTIYHLGDFCLSSDDYPKNYSENKHINLSVDVTKYNTDRAIGLVMDPNNGEILAISTRLSSSQKLFYKINQ